MAWPQPIRDEWWHWADPDGAYVGYYFPIEDVRFASLVDGFVDHVPDYPCRFLPCPGTAAERGLVPRYVTDRDGVPDAGEKAEVTVGGYGPFVVEGLGRWGPDQSYRLARILETPPSRARE